MKLKKNAVNLTGYVMTACCFFLPATYGIYSSREKILSLLCNDNQSIRHYTLNPHQHYRIWFSRDQNEFLPSKNRARLAEFRKQNPADTMTLIYSNQLLTTLAVLKLYYFCYFLSIMPLNFDQAVAKNSIEKELMFYANEEMIRHRDGGNLAAASDIVRFLSLTEKLGIYSDFDVTIDTAGAPSTVTIDAPMLLNLTFQYRRDYNRAGRISFLSLIPVSYTLNNDVLYIADFNADDIVFIQKKMVASCQLARSRASLFRVRRDIENAIPQSGNIQLRNDYIQTVSGVTGPDFLSSLITTGLMRDNKTRYSWCHYPHLKSIFKPNQQSDLSWIPETRMKDTLRIR